MAGVPVPASVRRWTRLGCCCCCCCCVVLVVAVAGNVVVVVSVLGHAVAIAVLLPKVGENLVKSSKTH